MVTRISTGIAGLDSVIGGGFLKERAYMVTGGPGCGKTTLCLHFLVAEPAEKSLLVTLDKNLDKIRWMADSLGLMTDNLVLEDLSPGDVRQETRESFDVVPTSELGLAPLVDRICAAVDRHQPGRVAIEPLSCLSSLAPDSFQFRRQSQALFNFLTERGATLVFSSEDLRTMRGEKPDADLYYIADGIINLERMNKGRMLSVTKIRGSNFMDGWHSMRLTDRGIQVFPRLVPEDGERSSGSVEISTGVQQLDAILHGGIRTATMTIIAGPTGAGKTTLGMQLVCAMAKSGDATLVCTFEESGTSILERCRNVGLPVDSLLDQARLDVWTIEPLAYSPDEMGHALRKRVQEGGVKTVMIDGSSGYSVSVANLAAPDESAGGRLHALCRYLVGLGVTVILINETPHISSENVTAADPGMTYLSDLLIMLRYIEMDSELRKTISVIKKRAGDFEKSLHEFDITDEGLRIGPPLRGLQGILRGQPIQVSTGRGHGNRTDDKGT
ncbi:ATPase domain-containing protein [Marinobacter sp.]|uniref:ATPase domain-containing protein n=1 Tax=Marinobacter sp. TaxID=50741 RepID=UPI00384D440B